MTKDDAKKVFDKQRAEGYSDDDILGVLYMMFQDDKFTLEELEGMVDALGYKLSEEFLAMSPEDQKTKGFEEE